MLIVDTSVLLAAADNADPDHGVCAEIVETASGPLVTTPLVIAETVYLGDRSGRAPRPGDDRDPRPAPLLRREASAP